MKQRDDGMTSTLLTVIYVVVLIFHGIHVRDVVHRHQTGKYRHHHLWLHLGNVFRQCVNTCTTFPR